MRPLHTDCTAPCFLQRLTAPRAGIADRPSPGSRSRAGSQGQGSYGERTHRSAGIGGRAWEAEIKQMHVKAKVYLFVTKTHSISFFI